MLHNVVDAPKEQVKMNLNKFVPKWDSSIEWKSKAF